MSEWEKSERKSEKREDACRWCECMHASATDLCMMVFQQADSHEFFLFVNLNRFVAVI